MIKENSRRPYGKRKENSAQSMKDRRRNKYHL